MPRQKGSKNKVTTEVKEMLRDLVHHTINSIPVDELDYDQRIKLLQVTLHYIVPKVRSVETNQPQQQDEPIFIEVLERKEGDEQENWKDNFEVTESYTHEYKKW